MITNLRLVVHVHAQGWPPKCVPFHTADTNFCLGKLHSTCHSEHVVAPHTIYVHTYVHTFLPFHRANVSGCSVHQLAAVTVKGLASLIADKQGPSCSVVLNALRCPFSFSLDDSTMISSRGGRSSFKNPCSKRSRLPSASCLSYD